MTHGQLEDDARLAQMVADYLSQSGYSVEVCGDGELGLRFAVDERPDLVLVGADRVARNGDVANKVGTYTLAVLAARHGIPFYVAAPRSTIDFACADGARIPRAVRARARVAAAHIVHESRSVIADLLAKLPPA